MMVTCTDGVRQWVYVAVVVMAPLSLISTVIMLFSPLIVEDVFRLHGDMIYDVSDTTLIYTVQLMCHNHIYGCLCGGATRRQRI